MKSHESDLVGLAEVIYKDASAKCEAVICVRDLNTIRSRVKDEGLSFLTITLPSISRDLEEALRDGGISPVHFRSFRKRMKIPAFLQGIFAKVFDMETGRLLDEPNIQAIDSIRQIANSFKKVRMDCEAKRVRRAFARFAQVEHDLQSQVRPGRRGDLTTFDHVARVLWSSSFNDATFASELVPKHGPGATAEGIHGNMKYRWQTWHERLECCFPFLEFGYSVSAYSSKEFQDVSFVPFESEMPVKVVSVPKTLKTPRIIAIEPVCMQYTQQALSNYIVTSLESGRYTSGHINFSDQSVNRALAMQSSKSGHYATIDLSDASDRVPLAMASRMLRSCPNLLRAALACRSTKAKLPDGSILTLRKFASMGSALCFPIEAMYFFTLCVKALLEQQKLPVTARNIYNVSRHVYVYGDDIIVPVDAASVVIRTLQDYYCKVNADKSFWTGKFRESCGMDAYDGVQVTPVYVREVSPNNKRCATQLISWVATANLFYLKGYWRTAVHMQHACELILGKLPRLSEEAGGLGWLFEANDRPGVNYRVNRQYQVLEAQTWVPRPVYRKDKLGSYAALQKCLIRAEMRPPSAFPGSERQVVTRPRSANFSVDPVQSDHLLRTARYRAVTLKRGWVVPG